MPEAITVIVPTFNRAGYLREALGALLAQTRPVGEIIVWDDGSTDGTAEDVRRMNGPVRYFRSSNGGKSRALNAALAEARGGYVWICDDDDIARPDAAEVLGGMLDAGSAGVAGGSYVRFREDAATGARAYMDAGYWPDLSRGSVLRHLLEDIFLFQNATMVRRAAYDRVGPFREDLPRSIDYDMIVRLAARFPVRMTERVLFEQRKHEGARGPLAARHTEAASEAVWLENDRRVFRELRGVLPLSLYAGMFEADEPVLACRAGLLQRACVHMRRDDWEPAVEDLAAAAALNAAGPLTTLEREICRRALSGKHGIREGLAPGTIRKILRSTTAGETGSAIARSLARGSVWRARAAIRRGEGAEAIRVARFTAVLAARGLSLRGRPAAERKDGRLRERSELPPSAYEW